MNKEKRQIRDNDKTIENRMGCPTAAKLQPAGENLRGEDEVKVNQDDTCIQPRNAWERHGHIAKTWVGKSRQLTPRPETQLRRVLFARLRARCVPTLAL